MKNRYVGVLVMTLGAVIGIITYMFNSALSQIVSTSCTHGTTCPMWDSISFQTNISLILMVAIIGLGVYIAFFSGEIKIVEKIIRKTIRVKEGKPKKNYIALMEELDDEERSVLQKVIDSNGTIFQSQIVDELGFPKAKITRILDKLEGRSLVERRRRGMTNVIILKH
jgi:uncharacterized membrane protein